MQSIAPPMTVGQFDTQLTMGERWERGMQQAGAQPTLYRTPIVRYATFRPMRGSEILLWGTATLNPSAHGWTWQQEGCDWTTNIRYNDPRLQVYGLVDEDEQQLPLFPQEAA